MDYINDSLAILIRFYKRRMVVLIRLYKWQLKPF